MPNLGFEPDPFLSHRQDLLEILFDRMPMGIAIFDLDLVLRRCNPTWADFIATYTATPADRVVPGARFLDLVPGSETTTLPRYRRALAGDTVREEAVPMNSNGVVSYWDVVITPLVQDGAVVGIVDVTTDVTERRKATEKLRTNEEELRRHRDHLEELVDERTAALTKTNELLQLEIAERHRAEDAQRATETRYRVLVENANSVILRLDTAGNVTFINEFAQRFFGYSPSEIVGRHVVGTIVPPVDVAGHDLRAMFDDLCRHPEQYVTAEYENVRRNGERVWVAWTHKAIVDEHAVISEILCVGNDHTDRRRGEEALQKARDELSMLLTVAQATSSSLELDQVLHTVAEGLCVGVGVGSCGIYVVDEETGLLMPKRGRSDRNAGAPPNHVYRSRPLDPKNDGFTRQALESKEPVACFDAENDPRTNKDIVQVLGLKSILAVPFVAKGRVVAVAMVSTFHHNIEFTEEQITLARGIANAAAVAIENARLYREEQGRLRDAERRRQVAESLKGILAIINSNQPLSEVLDFIVSEACRLLGTSSGAMYCLQPDGKELVVQSSCCIPGEYLAGSNIPLAEGALRAAVLRRRPIVVSDVSATAAIMDESQIDTAVRSYLARLAGHYRSLLAVPLVVKDEIYGGLVHRQG